MTSLSFGPVVLGGNVFGWTVGPDEGFAVLDMFLDGGGRAIDSADSYTQFVPGNVGGESETQIGDWLAARDCRNRVQLHTKVFSKRDRSGLRARNIVLAAEDSLRRLRTDHLDLYYAHFPDPDTPLEQTLAVYDDLIRQGKLRYVALSNHPAWQLTEALWIADDRRLASAPVCAQVMYSLLDRSAEAELSAACVRFGLSIVPYAPLHGGLLADLAVLDREIAGGKRYGGPGFSEAEIAVARELDRLARDWGLEMPQVSLAWLLSRPAVASVIVGAETVDELRANASAADVELTAEQLDAVSALTADPAP